MERLVVLRMANGGDWLCPADRVIEVRQSGADGHSDVYYTDVGGDPAVMEVVATPTEILRTLEGN